MKLLATFGGGCFWCTEALFKQLHGVEQVVSGYAGGHTDHPTYDQMHTGATGHAEVIQITFDPTIISYRELLEIFFTTHNPTTPDQQGNDIGTEYRSIILFHDEEQRQIAETVMQEFAAPLWDDPIVTEVKPLDTFWPAEDYHQDYFENNPAQAYCQIIINPKVQKFRKQFAEKLKTSR